MSKNTGYLLLNKEIRDIMQKANERAGRLGLHIVHQFHKDAISGEFSHRSGYFEDYSEAEFFATTLKVNLERYHTTGIILLDNDIFAGLLTGDDAKDFMADKEIRNPQEYIEVKDTKRIFQK